MIEMERLDEAIRNGSKEQIKNLVSSGEVDLREPLVDEDFKEPVILRALRKHQEELLPLLCSLGANVNAADSRGVTPLLQCAATYACNTHAAFLLKQGADPNIVDHSQRTALLWAVFLHNVALVEMLLEHGANANIPTKKKDFCLHLITGSNQPNNIPILKLLLENNADVNAVNNDGQSALFKAVRHNNLQHVKLLLKHGASANILDENNRTPLHMAVACTNPFPNMEIVKELIQSNAIINACDRYAFTPLSLALSSLAPNAVDTSCYLVHHGAIVQDPKVLQCYYFQLRDLVNITKMLKVMFHAGMSAHVVESEIKRILKSELYKNRTESSKELESIKELKKQCRQPIQLQHICRIIIRQEIIINTLGTSIIPFIDKLPLPQIMKEFLGMVEYRSL